MPGIQGCEFKCLCVRCVDQVVCVCLSVCYPTRDIRYLITKFKILIACQETTTHTCVCVFICICMRKSRFNITQQISTTSHCKYTHTHTRQILYVSSARWSAGLMYVGLYVRRMYVIRSSVRAIYRDEEEA